MTRRTPAQTSVDTGWINDEKPLERAVAHEKGHNFQTPIDEIDAAARQPTSPDRVSVPTSLLMIGLLCWEAFGSSHRPAHRGLQG